MSLKDKISKLKRYNLVCDWLEEHQSGEYVKYDDIISIIESLMKNKKIFVVYQLQRWDIVQLIKGYENEEEAEKLRSSLEEKEDRFDETYSVGEIEIKKCLKESTETLTKEQWKAFVKKLENVEYDEKLAQFYSKRENRYKISKDVKL